MTTQDLIDYYAGLLITQYAGKPNAVGTVAAFVRQVIADQIYAQVRDGFNFAIAPAAGDAAAGAQLDAVAAYTGAARLIYGLDLARPYFTMPTYGDAAADTAPGFARYGQTPINWFFLTYEDAAALLYRLNDSELYRLAQFRALTQSSLLSVSNVDDTLYTFFGTNVGAYETAMAITYIDLLSDTDTLFGIVAASNSLPRPAGVKINVMRSQTITNFFGMQIYGRADNPTFVGLGLYGAAQAGSFVRYG